MLIAEDVKVGQRIRAVTGSGDKRVIQAATVTAIYPRFAQIVYDETGIRDTIALVPRDKIAK